MENTTEQIMDNYLNSLCNAMLAIDNGTATQSDSLIWLVSLTEMWVRESTGQLDVAESQLL